MTYRLTLLAYNRDALLEDDERFDTLIAKEIKRLSPVFLYLVAESSNPVLGRYTPPHCEKEFHGLLGDCMFVTNSEKRTVKVIDFQDSPDSGPGIQMAQDPGWRGSILTMFYRPRVERIFGNRAYMVHPGWFLDQAPPLTRRFRSDVRMVRKGELDPRLHFRGTINKCRNGSVYGPDRRKVAEVLREKYPDEVLMTDEHLDRPSWFLTAAKHKINLTLPGHPWCYREFELMSLGIPFIAYPWHTHVEAGAMPVPGAHYIATRSIPRHDDGHARDPEDAADAIITAHRAALAWPDGTLDTMGQRCQRWYDLHLSPTAIATGLLNLLDLESGW